MAALVALALLCLAAVGAALVSAACVRHAALPLVHPAARDLRGDRAAAAGRGLSAWRACCSRRARCCSRSAGIAAALYQHFVAAKSASCNLTLADKIVSGLGLDKALPPVFEVNASCADAAVDLLHVPYEFWSLGLYVLLVAAVIWVLRLRST